ncbi:GIMAP protein [Biomphalaria glabrata]
MTNLELVLVGKPGCGKSSTGNSILNKSVFEISNSTQGKAISYLVREVDTHQSFKIAVIDGFNVNDCGDKAEFNQVENLLRLSGLGLNAFLIVIHIGERFGAEDKKAINMTKLIFGEDVIQKFGILAFTHGDNFTSDTTDDDLTSLSTFLENETGDLYSLYIECNRRFFLFNNKTGGLGVKKDTTHNFQKLLRQNKMHLNRYTKQNYECNVSGRKHLILMKKAKDIKDQFDTKMQEKHTQIALAEKKRNIPELEAIKKDLENLLKELEREFGINSDYSKEMENVINAEISAVQSKLKCLQLLISEVPSGSPLTGKESSVYFSTNGTHQTIQMPYSQCTWSDDQTQLKLKFEDIYKIESLLLIKYRDILNQTLEDKIKKDVQTKMSVLESSEFVRMFGNKECEEIQDMEQEQEQILTRKVFPSNSITLFLWGCAGNGKSASGNAILGRTVFSTSTNTSSKKGLCMKESVMIDHRLVYVVDCPGITATHSSDVFLKCAMDTADEALQLCNYIFSALVIVLKYGEKFTRQENENIQNIKAILGRDVIKKHGICLVTHGDNYDDNDDNQIPFEDWCREQEDDVKLLFEECNFRCVLFNNKTKDSAVRSAQVNRLLQAVTWDHTYTIEDFIAASEFKNNYLVEKELPMVVEKANIFLDGKRKEMKNIESLPNKQDQHTLLSQIKEGINRYREECIGSTENQTLINLFQSILMDVESRLKITLNRKYPKATRGFSESYKKSDLSVQARPSNTLQSVPAKQSALDQQTCRYDSIDLKELYNKWYRFKADIDEQKKRKRSSDLKVFNERFFCLQTETLEYMTIFKIETPKNLQDLIANIGQSLT